MAMQEFLASYAVEVDEAGVKRLQEALKTDRELAEALAGAFDAARDSLKSLDASLDALDIRAALKEKLQISDLPTIDLRAELDMTEATSAAEIWMAQVEAMRPKLKVNTSGMTTAVSSAVSSIRSMLSSLSISVPVRAVVTLDTSGLPDGGSDDTGDSGEERGGSDGITIPAFANGGRVDTPTIAMIGEESEPEYVIPVNKEERAVPLVRDLLSEMSEPAKESVFDEEENKPEKEFEAKQEEVPSVRESFFSSKPITPITDLFNHDEETETPSVSDVGSVPTVNAVLPAAEEALHEEDVSAASEAGRLVISSAPEPEAIPLVQEALAEAESIRPVGEVLREPEATPSVQGAQTEAETIRPIGEALPEMEAIPSVRESLTEAETIRPVGEALPETDYIPLIREALPETEAVPLVQESLPEAEVIPTEKETIHMSEKIFPVMEASTEDQHAYSVESGDSSFISLRRTEEPSPRSRRTEEPSPRSPRSQVQPVSPDVNITEPVFPPVTNQAKEMDLALIRNAIADLSKMKLPKAGDAEFVPEMLRELTDVARSQFLPAGVAAPAASHSVEAPVTIQVNSPYASPEEVGRSVYDLTQRYLLRTMKGVFA